MVVVVDGRLLKDSSGRSITLRGVNFGGNFKLPSKPDGRTHIGSHFFEADHVNFVDELFTPDVLDSHCHRIKAYGFNVVRLIVTWEAIEHEGP